MDEEDRKVDKLPPRRIGSIICLGLPKSSFLCYSYPMMSSNRIQKKTFILLELLIAFSLVAFSIVPFIRFPLHQIKKETDFLFRMELERIVNNTFCHMMETILQKEIPEQNLFIKNKKLNLNNLEKEIKIFFSEAVQRTYFCENFIKCNSVLTKEEEQIANISLIINIYEKQKSKKQKPLINAKQKLLVRKKTTPIKT